MFTNLNGQSLDSKGQSRGERCSDRGVTQWAEATRGVTRREEANEPRTAAPLPVGGKGKHANSDYPRYKVVLILLDL